MKLNQPQVGGSFGIPQELRDAQEKRRQRAEEAAAKAAIQDNTDGFGVDMDEEDESSTTEEKIQKIEKNLETQKEEDPLQGPLDILKDLGIVPTEDDFNNLVFRGFVEKTVELFKIPITNKPFTAKLKTLTADEMDLVDELVTIDMDTVKMTRNGYEIRRSMWITSFAVVELQGKPVAKPVLVDNVPSPIGTAKARRAVLSALSPYVLDIIINKHAKLSAAFNVMLMHPEASIVKK